MVILLMIPIVSLVGKNNVGKSSLFKKLICKKQPSLKHSSTLKTRDRKYGYVKWKKKEFIVIDTGGVKQWKNNSEIDSLVLYQTLAAIKESDIILLMLDYTNQSIEFEKNFLKILKNFERKTILIVINKVDQTEIFKRFEVFGNKYFCLLGRKNVFPISVLFGYGIENLIKKIFSIQDFIHLSFSHYRSLKQEKNLISFQKLSEFNGTTVFSKKNDGKYSPLTVKKKIQENIFIKISVVGYPNVGKSTFINSILKEERVITFNTPGTTQENVFIPFEYKKKRYIFIDTPGIKKSFQRNEKKIEGFFIKNTMEAIQNSDIVLLVFDAARGILNQEFFLLKNIQKKGKPFIFIVNKWDKLSYKSKRLFIHILKVELRFVMPTHIHYISSLSKKIKTKEIFDSIQEIHQIFMRKIQTSTLTDMLKQAVEKQKIPCIRGKKIKLNLARIGRHSPVTVIIHGTNVQYIPKSYKRYLEKFFRSNLNYSGILIEIKFCKKDTH